MRAVGTAFNVRKRDNAIDVLVTEGKVRVEDTSIKPGEAAPVTQLERFLVAGERLSIAVPKVATEAPVVPPVPTVVPRDEIARALAWQQQRLQFDGTTLSEVVEEFNRHNKHQLVIADPSLADQRFGGAFAARGYDAFVEILEQSFGVKADRRENETILRRAGK